MNPYGYGRHTEQNKYHNCCYSSDDPRVTPVCVRKRPSIFFGSRMTCTQRGHWRQFSHCRARALCTMSCSSHTALNSDSGQVLVQCSLQWDLQAKSHRREAACEALSSGLLHFRVSIQRFYRQERVTQSGSGAELEQASSWSPASGKCSLLLLVLAHQRHLFNHSSFQGQTWLCNKLS